MIRTATILDVCHHPSCWEAPHPSCWEAPHPNCWEAMSNRCPVRPVFKTRPSADTETEEQGQLDSGELPRENRPGENLTGLQTTSFMKTQLPCQSFAARSQFFR